MISDLNQVLEDYEYHKLIKAKYNHESQLNHCRNIISEILTLEGNPKYKLLNAQLLGSASWKKIKEIVQKSLIESRHRLSSAVGLFNPDITSTLSKIAILNCKKMGIIEEYNEFKPDKEDSTDRGAQSVLNASLHASMHGNVPASVPNRKGKSVGFNLKRESMRMPQKQQSVRSVRSVRSNVSDFKS